MKFLPVVIAGGAGSRLWPITRSSMPKQFLDLLGEGESLLGATVRRLEPITAPLVVTTEALRLGSKGLLDREDRRATVIGEPEAKNTAAAVALGAHWAKSHGFDTIGVFPADHTISPSEAFRECVMHAAKAATDGGIVVFGIPATFASTAYGYIDTAPQAGAGPRPVRSFMEKPAKERAQKLVESGHALWNSGMLVAKTDTLIAAFRLLQPEIATAFERLKPDLSNLKEIYLSLPKISFDHAVLEKAKNVVCLPATFSWSDIGSWEEVASQSHSAAMREMNASNNFYVSSSATAKKAFFLGVDDLVAVDTPDALLVMKKGFGQSVKTLTEEEVLRDPKRINQHAIEEKPWGKYEVLADLPQYKIKRLTVLPGKRLSYQSHKRRSEHWMVIRGIAKVTLEGVEHVLGANQHIHIPVEAKHRIENPGPDVMEFVEVQTGNYFGEDDIIRYSDDFGRIS